MRLAYRVGPARRSISIHAVTNSELLIEVQRDCILQGNRQVIRPLLVTASPNLLVMSLRDDVVGFFSVSIPTETKTVGPPLLAWARPVIIAIVALIVIWHFGNKRYMQYRPFLAVVKHGN